jgi:Inactivated superfamily I helicase
MSVKTYLRLLKQLVNSTSVPFKGEPLAGLQVMGVLEARCLDFDNIVICSMNEGVFPSRNLSTSFIPLNLRKGFSLPENEYADAVSAYSFYRTIYRAKRVWMLYDTRSEGLSSGEQSRFILQLRYHYKIPLRDMVSSGVVTRNQKSPIIIEKKGVVAQELEKFRSGTKFFSASLLSTYILCPLKFYFMHIEGVKDEEIVSESVESRTFGTILHNSMAILYRRFEGKDVCKKDLLAILNNQSLIDDIIYKEFKKEKGVEDVKGYNYIICNLIQRYIIKIIKYDLGFNSFRYIQSEKDIRSSLKLRDGTEVKLKAYIDRIDRVNGKLRIIDYKTGRKPDTMKSLNQLFEQNSSKNLSVFFQLYLYGLMLSPEGESLLLPYFLRELDQKYQINCTVEDLNSFRELLSSKISEILNVEMPFIQTASQKSCEYCIFKQICR